MSLDETRQYACGSFYILTRWRGIDDGILKKIPLCIECHNLAAGAIAGVKSKYPLPFQRGCEKKLTEIVGEYVNGHLIRLLFQVG